ncbi:hypothetical protein DVH26_20550 [Paenibacillus sp. H1-7]|uniref:fibronectin type III domain-containing protein n=1 Tax=Paenibacillus sp. H1-7 TaxID=2282849 RepID=UPI001EF8E1AB|nr:discoidin domain-containing protein [Paenibacillus sp. H1-7]ULL16622.1 hypothetical protein DVH26_20550 [Paenibacillus sp. H1-7]
MVFIFTYYVIMVCVSVLLVWIIGRKQTSLFSESRLAVASGRVSALPKKQLLYSALIAGCIGFLPGTQALGAMVVEEYHGPITQNDINSFKEHMMIEKPKVWAAPMDPTTERFQTEYAQGKSGENIKALGLMYELTGDTEILDRMIYFTGTLLTQRNDILPAPYGQRTIWTGTIAPVWPGPVEEWGVAADSAQGDSIGHLAYTGRLILQTPWILDTVVPDGDPYGHGATYRERASTFVREAEYVVDEFIFPYLIDLSRDNKLYFSGLSPYMSNGVMPWNQIMMILYPFQNLAAAHEILGDNPSLVTKYDGIVQRNIDWFFKDDTTKAIVPSNKGNPSYSWGYNPGRLPRPGVSPEDSSHGQLDVAGFYRAYLIGRYGVTEDMLKPFANTFADNIMRSPTDYAGRIDGTDGSGNSAKTSAPRSGYLFLPPLRPDKYDDLAGTVMKANTSMDMASVSRFYWAKNKLSNNNDTGAPTVPANVKAVAASSSQIILSWAESTDDRIVRNYNIYRNGTLVGTSTTTSFTDKGLNTETAYSYTVKAKDAAGNLSAASSTVSATTWDLNRRDTEAPTAPTNLKAAVPSNMQIDLSWNASTDDVFVAGYEIYRNLTKIATVDTTSFSDNGLTGGTTYNYEVKAIDLAGNLSAAGTISATTLVNLALGKPDASYFASSQWSTTYIPRKAFDGSVSNSRWSSVKTGINNQYLGVNFGTSTTFNQVVIKEISYPRVSSYVLQYSNDGVTYTDIEGMVGTTLGANKTLVFVPVTSQYFRLNMIKSSAEPTIDEIEIYYVTGGPSPSAAPAGLSATAGDKKVTLGWRKVPGATYYDVKRSTSANGPFTIVGLQLNSISFTDSSVQNGTTYYYTVTAGNVGGGGPAAGPVNATPKAPPQAAPTGLTAVAGDGQVTLTWDTVTGATYSYNVSRSTAATGGFEEIGSDLNTNSFTDEEVENGKTYYYIVRASNEIGEGPATAPVSATPMDSTPPVTTAVVEGTQQNGWYSGAVSVRLEATDNSSGVPSTFYKLTVTGATYGSTVTQATYGWLPYTGPVTITEDEKFTFHYYSQDKDGNAETEKTLNIQHDATGPAIQSIAPVNNGRYSDSEQLTIQVNVGDTGSGLNPDLTVITLDGNPVQQGAVIQLYTLPLGAHTLNITAKDMAGNTRSVAVPFTTETSIASLKAVIVKFRANGWIDNGGIANSLEQKLEHGNLDSFINEVEAQSGKHISAAAAAILLRDANKLYSQQ